MTLLLKILRLLGCSSTFFSLREREGETLGGEVLSCRGNHLSDQSPERRLWTIFFRGRRGGRGEKKRERLRIVISNKRGKGGKGGERRRPPAARLGGSIDQIRLIISSFQKNA